MRSRTTQLVRSIHAFAIHKKIMMESVNPAKGSRPRIQLGNRKYVDSYVPRWFTRRRVCPIEFLALLWREKVKGMIRRSIFCGRIKLKTEIGIGGISRLQGLAWFCRSLMPRFTYFRVSVILEDIDISREAPASSEKYSRLSMAIVQVHHPNIFTWIWSGAKTST